MDSLYLKYNRTLDKSLFILKLYVKSFYYLYKNYREAPAKLESEASEEVGVLYNKVFLLFI